MTDLITTSRKPISLTDWLAKNWFLVFVALYGLWVWTPFLAPLFMHLGLEAAGNTIYFIYSFFCHQLPERSYFLFGPHVSYSLADVQIVWKDTVDPMLLRKFTGTAAMGWKVAWSDRMISFYGGVWFFALLWYPLRRRLRYLPWWGLILLLFPMLLDGTTHFISDLSGIGQGYRDSNLWLANLTQSALPVTFYAGDALGSFNAWMRIVTGMLAGLGLVWFVFPYLGEAFSTN